MEAREIKILLVEDDPFAREMLKMILAGEKFNVITANNGVDALNKFYSTPNIDLIVSDMNMPEMDGLELIQKLREQDVDKPIIILTGNREIKTAIKTIYSGANDYLLKDENIEDTFIVSIQRTWEHYQLELERRRLLADLEHKNKELERLSFLDGLTGISNRRYFDKVFEQEWRRCFRERIPIGLLMADIDYFKLFNDTYGHQVGDDCLKKVAEALNESLLRPADFIARYGGEEFIAVLPHVDVNGTDEVARRMMASIHQLNIPHSKSEASDRVTLSIGMACVVPDRHMKLEKLIETADQALYSAKQSGRNRICHG